ncbi:monocarboxylate transporter 13-like isoform X6 [Mercenaria mercenaria]|uniref:monocarboxylate transporter 13-like isoform X6 n=1 Tax=Mercenaria mercenaria TaxID=6596 RepID=UPI00234F01C6|nr:monocarboxylate transporter 13-like isoform X6 [Mercenaria mercenaria]
MRIQKDRGWALIVLFCVICSQLILGGFCFSGGIFYMIFMDVFPSDPIGVSWLCSLPITMWFISAPIGSYVTNRYGYRTCALIDGVIAATGLTLTYFATSLSFLFISHGILTGALFPAVINGIVGFDRFADGMGISLPFKATANLIGGPLAGILLASTGSYEISFYIAGVSMVFSQVLMIHPIVHQKQREKAHRNKDIYTVCEISVENCTEADACIKPLYSSCEIKQEILSV